MPQTIAAMGPLIDSEGLRPDHVVVDCRFQLGDPDAGERAYLAGHVPGAAFLNLDRDLSAPPGDGGRHPLPDPERFAAAARRAGISAESSVVAYDGGSDGGAARLWWLLRHFGHTDVAVLDGGLGVWSGELATGPEEIPPGDFEIRRIADDTVSREDVEAIVAGGGPILLDARAPERYRGEVEPIDPVAGHIPGAVNLPHQLLAPDGRFLPPNQLREHFAAAACAPSGLGRDMGSATTDRVAYCGSGVTATVLILAAEAAGLPAPRLYPGSWSEWCR
jgi:thiosulfate/3-mercaptopyruvate sulfurtransferase